MVPSPETQLYSPAEIARAAGVPIEHVLAALNGSGRASRFARYVPHPVAVRIGRALVRRDDRLFTIFSGAPREMRSRPVFALSSGVHAAVVFAFIGLATFNIAPDIAAVRGEDVPPAAMQLVFLAEPGPGGGGGGGGLEQPAPPPKARLEGTKKISSPIVATPPRRDFVYRPPPRSVARAELPAPVVAPIAALPADTKTRPGVPEETKSDADSAGPGKGGGVGTGTGVGVGPGNGSGIGPGSGGGFGGGPYRPGSGIEAPRLLREVKADYTEDARKRGLAGEVVVEIVVRSDGSVGDAKILQGLDGGPGGLNERALQAVRQWKFAPAMRQGTPVDVYVEVVVDFHLR